MSRNTTQLLWSASVSLEAYRQQLPKECAEYKSVSKALRYLNKAKVFYSLTRKGQEEEEDLQLKQVP